MSPERIRETLRSHALDMAEQLVRDEISKLGGYPHKHANSKEAKKAPHHLNTQTLATLREQSPQSLQSTS
jgi:hypothetical protein